MYPGCNLELVLVGTFPNARYFDITNNDTHLATAQHLADADMDPVGNSASPGTNPFTPSQPDTGSQTYLVPISLGYVPTLSATQPGCGINPFENDNLIDATQRHLSMDWNTSLTAFATDSNLPAHTLDSPGHGSQTYTYGSSTLPAGPNTGGKITIRSYLEPPWTCIPNLYNGDISCSPPECISGTGGCYPGQGAPSAIPFQYFIVRDVNSGCAYTKAYVEACLMLPTSNNPEITCPNNAYATANTAVVASASEGNAVASWVDSAQQDAHIAYAAITPDACYANGNFGAAPNYPSAVAWTRAPEYQGLPGPDDAYIGGAISGEDMLALYSGDSDSNCQATTYGCMIRFQFELPDMPDTPCVPATNCGLTGNEDMRYMSLTFWYPFPSCDSSQAQSFIADPDGVNPDQDINCGSTLISLADTAFGVNTVEVMGTVHKYATLLVNVAVNAQNKLGTGFFSQTGSSAVGQAWGVQPVQPPPPAGGTSTTYSVWTVTGGSGNYFTVLDLTQFPAFTTVGANYKASDLCYLNVNGNLTCNPLLFTIRNTLPNTAFQCSGAAVPFSTAVYTNADGNGAGLMGPYLPLVDFVNPDPNVNPGPPLSSGPGIPSLPNPSYCATFPTNATPQGNGPTATIQETFPKQFWPQAGQSGPPNLTCGTTTPSPQAYFAATQAVDPITSWASLEDVSCTSPSTQCSQIILPSTQTTELPGQAAWQPALALTIVGLNFGNLPTATLPQAVQNSSYLEITDCIGGGTLPCPASWSSTTANCQMVISNWTDTSISVVVNLPIGVQDAYQQDYETPEAFLSPLSDVSPTTFLAAAPATSPCPISVGDDLNFTVTNPQTGGTGTASLAKIQVVQAGTARPH
jgi:hypothetical protein